MFFGGMLTNVYIHYSVDRYIAHLHMYMYGYTLMYMYIYVWYLHLGHIPRQIIFPAGRPPGAVYGVRDIHVYNIIQSSVCHLELCT